MHWDCDNGAGAGVDPFALAAHQSHVMKMRMGHQFLLEISNKYVWVCLITEHVKRHGFWNWAASMGFCHIQHQSNDKTNAARMHFVGGEKIEYQIDIGSINSLIGFYDQISKL